MPLDKPLAPAQGYDRSGPPRVVDDEALLFSGQVISGQKG
jgi:hypothetical protein